MAYYNGKKVLSIVKSGGGGGISVIELTDKNGTIASTQLSEINANPQNFAFKYNGKILLFTKADSTTYQYCNNTTSSSDNNVMTTSALLTITSSTGVYTIAENVHNVVANSIHPANGGDLKNIQVGSKVYSIPSGGGSTAPAMHVYSVRIDELCHYEVYTTKDYGFTIGSIQTIIDFKTNDTYKELRTEGHHPATGYIEIIRGNHKMIVGDIEIGSSWFVKGYDLTQGEPRTYITESTDFTVIKLY